MRLPLLKPYERAHTYCTYCPKLCRHACPVSTAQASETTTPWAKMSTLHHQAAGRLPRDAEHARTAYACTGCLRCKQHCDHDNPVADTLNAARAEAVAARVAPDAAYAVIEAHQARQVKAHDAAKEIFGDALTRSSETFFFPGCTGCVTQPDDAKAGLTAVEGLARTRARVVADGCCGLPLLEAGDREGFLSAARRAHTSFSGAARVVFQDPGCLHALSVTAPSLDASIKTSGPGKPELLHLSQLAERHLERLTPAAAAEPMRYHDPCRLGRGLGVYDAPRRVIERVTGQEVAEFHHSREDAECSGGGGQLPRTDPATAEAITRERLRTHAREGGGVLVTACPGSAKRFRAREGGPEVVSLAALIAGALDVR